jgi:hypothetical protein
MSKPIPVPVYKKQGTPCFQYQEEKAMQEEVTTTKDKV